MNRWDMLGDVNMGGARPLVAGVVDYIKSNKLIESALEKGVAFQGGDDTVMRIYCDVVDSAPAPSGRELWAGYKEKRADGVQGYFELSFVLAHKSGPISAKFHVDLRNTSAQGLQGQSLAAGHIHSCTLDFGDAISHTIEYAPEEHVVYTD